MRYANHAEPDWREAKTEHGRAPAIVEAMIGEEIQERLDALTGAPGFEAVPGISLAVFDGERVHGWVSGTASRRTGCPVTPGTLFRIASITKLYTATLAMQLVDDALLELDRPVVERLPDFRLARAADTAAVTPRHLLSHTSGISGDIQFDGGRGDDAVARWVANLAHVEPLFPPGLLHSYSNAGYVVLGRLVERAREATWDDALRKRLVEPLGLEETLTLPEDVLPWPVAVGHASTLGTGELNPVRAWNANRGSGPCGVISASAREVVAFARMHLDRGLAASGGRVLSEASAAAMVEPQVRLPRHSGGAAWGLGFSLTFSGERLVPGHGGNVAGQTSQLLLVPDRHAAVAIMTNSDVGSLRAEPLLRDLLREWFGVALPGRLRPPEVPPAVPIEPYLGVYDRGDMVLEVAVSGEGVTLSQTDRLGRVNEGKPLTFPLIPCEDGVFLLKADWLPEGLPVVFDSAADGRLYLRAGGRTVARTG